MLCVHVKLFLRTEEENYKTFHYCLLFKGHRHKYLLILVLLSLLLLPHTPLTLSSSLCGAAADVRQMLI